MLRLIFKTIKMLAFSIMITLVWTGRSMGADLETGHSGILVLSTMIVLFLDFVILYVSYQYVMGRHKGGYAFVRWLTSLASYSCCDLDKIKAALLRKTMRIFPVFRLKRGNKTKRIYSVPM